MIWLLMAVGLALVFPFMRLVAYLMMFFVIGVVAVVSIIVETIIDMTVAWRWRV